MSAVATKELYSQYVMPTYGRFDLQFAKGQGCRVWDEAGKEYLDFGSGIAVTSVGHSHPRVVAALQKQVGELVHVSNLYYNRPQALLAERLVKLIGLPGKIFFCNSGAEANEALYKLARKFGNETQPPIGTHTVGELVEPRPNRHTIITMDGSFHGRTLAGIAATGQEKVKIGFDPIVTGFTQVPFNDGPALLGGFQDPSVCAVLMEPIQGERGVHPASKGFLQTARDLCDRHHTLLMFDEVQCGLGRTGHWAGWRALNPNIVPDAISWAKGIGGGFPLGAVWVSNKPVQLKSGGVIPLCDLLGPGSHGTTFGGTPLVSAGALEVLTVMEEEGLLENARTQGAYAKQAWAGIGSPLIKEVRGVGLMLAMELVADFAKRVELPKGKTPSLLVVEKLHAAGLLTVPSGSHAVRWLPALNVSQSEIDRAVELTRGVLQSLVP